ncbi:MAG: EAL domain-containing protein, partial [Stenotrophobium sp.]
FMPAAQRHHLTLEMDRWVVGRVAAHLARNPDLAARLAFVNISISAESLAEPALVEHIVRVFENTPSLPPHKICFALDEEAIAKLQQQARLFGDAMHGIGCRLCVDHFNGRRVSDLGMLRRLPLDYVKIDSTQFRNIVTDPVEQMLAESLVRLARTLRKKITVNNLDENTQLEAWRIQGVDYYQGFVIAKPTPVVFAAPAR